MIRRTMRSQLFLIPAALVAAAVPASASATVYMSLEKAQKKLFPGATLTPAFKRLSESQYQKLVSTANVTVWNREIRVWHASTGGWFFLDQVNGRDDWVSYAVALNEEGQVTGIEVMECVDRYDQIRNPAWLAQFKHHRHGTLRLEGDIQNISGTTLSVDHLTGGVKRLLATYALYIAPPSG
jgi:hypothetical protein